MKAGATDGAVGVAVGAAGAAGAAGSSDEPHAKTTNKLNPKAIPTTFLVVSPKFIFSLRDHYDLFSMSKSAKARLVL
jgi:hypothetical protein